MDFSQENPTKRNTVFVRLFLSLAGCHFTFVLFCYLGPFSCPFPTFFEKNLSHVFGGSHLIFPLAKCLLLFGIFPLLGPYSYSFCNFFFWKSWLREFGLWYLWWASLLLPKSPVLILVIKFGPPPAYQLVGGSWEAWFESCRPFAAQTPRSRRTFLSIFVNFWP